MPFSYPLDDATASLIEQERSLEECSVYSVNVEDISNFDDPSRLVEIVHVAAGSLVSDKELVNCTLFCVENGLPFKDHHF